jgi:polyisoprenyl-teichoic acid--peptidoglycan teichoic acid transferase
MCASDINFLMATSIGPSVSVWSYRPSWRKVSPKETVTNPAKFVSFARGVSQHITVDDQLTESELRKTALSLRLRPKDVHMLQAPISGFGTSPTRQSIDVVDKKRLAELAEALQNDHMDRYLDKYPEG